MSKSSTKTRRQRRQRRQDRAMVRFGWHAKPHHISRSGRTGKIHTAQLKGQAPRAKGTAGEAAQGKG